MIFVLKDTLYDEFVSKIHNFTVQWSKYYPFVRMAFYELPFKEDDIIIVNLYKGNPYGKYEIPEKCKQLFIVHEINKENFKYLDNADFVIYINDYQKKISEDIIDIKKPNIIAPRFPTFDHKTKVNKKNWIYIGGWMTEEKTNGLYERLVKLHKKTPPEVEFGMYPIWGKVNKYKDLINDISKNIHDNSIEFGDRNIFLSTNELFYDTMIFKTRICKYAFLWDNGPPREKIKELISTKNNEVLNYSTAESSMLATFQSNSDCNLIVEDSIKFIPYYEEKEKFTYKDFAKLVSDAIKELSEQ